jgi:hypothetical protein
MTIKYRSNHNTYEMIVDQILDDAFLVVMLRTGVTVGSGNILHSYSSLDNAKHASEIFPQMYAIAQELGFSLADKYFVNSNGKRVHVSNAMDLDMTPELFKSFLVSNDAIL